MNDYLVKALAYNGQVRAYAVRTTDTIREAQKRHGTWRTASAALGRAMTASVMLGTMQKGDTTITVKIEGNGPLRLILVDANTTGDVRGYVANPHVDLEAKEKGKLDVSGAVGTEGSLTVVKDMGMRDKFSGQVPLISGELAEDFTYYFASSEQTPSSVALGTLINPDDSVEVAGGFIIQLLPGTPEEVITELEAILSIFPPVSALLAQGLTPEEILYQLFTEEDVTILEKMPVQFKCKCSKERIEKALISLGKAELREMIDEDGAAETNCHFCNKFYHFDKLELEKLYEEAT